MDAERCKLLDQLNTHMPRELRHLAQWVVWRMEERDGKPTKVPYSAKSLGKADSTEPATWATFSQACRTYDAGDYAGLGFVFTQHDPGGGSDSVLRRASPGRPP